MLLGWIVLLDDRRNRPLAAAGTWLAGASILTGLYLLARHAAGAYTPATAPDYYRFVLAPSRIWRHAYIYADETLTFPLLVTIAAALLLGLPAPARDRRQDRVLLACALWIAGGYGLTLLIPARSDLYACLPAIGACLGAAAWCERCWHQTTAARRARTRLAMLVGCVILSPIYVARTRTRSALMAFGARVLPEIQREVADVPESSRVRVDDDETARRTNAPNLEDAFGSMLDEAYALETGRRLTFAIVLPADADPDGLAAARHLRLIGGHIVRVDVTGEGLTPASSLSPVSSSPR